MNTNTIPLGFRFEPTGEELIRAFLLQKLMGEELPWDGIVEKNLYGDEAAPWAVLGNAPAHCWRSKREGGATKSIIYAFTTLPKQSPESKRNKRVAGGGTWRGESCPKKIFNSDNGHVIGYSKTLKFRCSEPDGDVADWNMYEYGLTENVAKATGVPNAADFVVCKITRSVKDSKKKRKRGGEEMEKAVCGGEDWKDEDLESLLDSI